MTNGATENLLFKPALNKPLGEILIEAGLVSPYQIEIALQEQMQGQEQRIGEILALHGWIKQETADFFVERWSQLLRAEQKQPLVYYFRAAALLDEAQIQTLLEEQKQSNKKIRFHRLVVQKGWLKQITVDFFLAHLFNIYRSTPFSFNKPYEILRRYIKGETNFQRAELAQVPLMGVSLKGVNLNGSNFKEADLNSSNLSNSSLVQSNLSNVNLRKAILTEVNLERACLSQADLRESHLERADFKGADLQKADLRDAYLFQANFAAADLRGAKLPKECTYVVYYDQNTCFDSSFDPQQAGWQQQ